MYADLQKPVISVEMTVVESQDGIDSKPQEPEGALTFYSLIFFHFKAAGEAEVPV